MSVCYGRVKHLHQEKKEFKIENSKLFDSVSK